MQIDRVGIHFGALTLTFFGLLLVAGLMAGGYLATRAARRRDENPDHVVDGLTWAILGGLVGARLFHIFAPPLSMATQGLTTVYYLTHPFDLQYGPLAIWSGGLNALGALVGGVFGLWIYTRRQRLDFPLWADIAALGAPLGIAIGSAGNLTSGRVPGLETALPWGITAASGGTRCHPAPAYLSLWALLVLGGLHWIERRSGERLRPGDLSLWFVVLLMPGLFLFEAFRAERRLLLAHLSVIQIAATLACVGGSLWLGARHRRVSGTAEAA
jgi:phosphatidylglycerol:prolipoprotein diacylglycerol transferase